MDRYFLVTLRFQYPAWDEKDGIVYRISAKDRAQAIRYARRQASDDGHTSGMACVHGRTTYRAKLDPDQSER